MVAPERLVGNLILDASYTSIMPQNFSHVHEFMLMMSLFAGYRIIFTELVIKCLLTFIVDPARKLIKKIMYGVKAMRAFGTLRFNVVRHSLDVSIIIS